MQKNSRFEAVDASSILMINKLNAYFKAGAGKIMVVLPLRNFLNSSPRLLGAILDRMGFDTISISRSGMISCSVSSLSKYIISSSAVRVIFAI